MYVATFCRVYSISSAIPCPDTVCDLQCHVGRVRRCRVHHPVSTQNALKPEREGCTYRLTPRVNSTPCLYSACRTIRAEWADQGSCQTQVGTYAAQAALEITLFSVDQDAHRQCVGNDCDNARPSFLNAVFHILVHCIDPQDGAQQRYASVSLRVFSLLAHRNFWSYTRAQHWRFPSPR